MTVGNRFKIVRNSEKIENSPKQSNYSSLFRYFKQIILPINVGTSRSMMDS